MSPQNDNLNTAAGHAPAQIFALVRYDAMLRLVTKCLTLECPDDNDVNGDDYAAQLVKLQETQESRYKDWWECGDDMLQESIQSVTTVCAEDVHACILPCANHTMRLPLTSVSMRPSVPLSWRKSRVDK